MQKFTHQHFGFAVFTLYLLHVIASLLGCMYIGHGIKLQVAGQRFCAVSIICF